MQKKIMVLEDEDSLRGDLVEFLIDCGYETSGYGNTKDFQTNLQTTNPNIVLLDINLPDGDGYTVAQKVREKYPSTGIIMLTCRGALKDKLHGYNAGADAYLVKHTDLQEIEATINSLLRRLSSINIKEEEDKGYWVLDKVKWTITSPTGKTLCLTSSELALLNTLFINPGAVFSRDVICQNMDRPLKDEPDRGIDAIIKRLRQKFERQTGEQLPIAIVYGVGYAFTGRVKIEE